MDDSRAFPDRSGSIEVIRRLLGDDALSGNAALADALPLVFEKELDDASQYFLAEAFDTVTAEWRKRYDPSLADGDLEVALRLMVSRVAEEPASGPPIPDTDPRLSKILVTGLGGYVWRLAEREAGRSIEQENANIDDAIGSFTSDAFFASLGVTDRAAVLFQVSASCVVLQVPLWQSSPGYLVWGLNLFRAGARWVVEETPFDAEGLAAEDLFYAFYFGAALFHVEERLNNPETPKPGAFVGPDWEHCEIVLRTERHRFVAEAQGGSGRYDAATSSKLPSFRFRLLDGRDSEKLLARHDELVTTLERDGWTREESRGDSWYSVRFRRRVPR